MLRISLLTVVFAALLALSACGGGGGGGGGSSGGGGGGAPAPAAYGPISPEWQVTSVEANVYRTTEYNRQWGLEAIHAAEAYAALENNGKAIAGAGVKIAIVDTGAVVDHPDIAANLYDVYGVAAGNYDYYNGGNNINDTNGHGSNVASIAAGVKNNAGTVGVAFNSTIVVSDTYCCVVDGGAALGNTNVALFDSSLISGVRVINASFGGSGTVSENTKDAVREIKDRDVLMVAAAGNSQGANPSQPASLAGDSEFAGYVLAVGAVDDNSTLASFSNKCGTAKEYCLVAPGVSIYGAYAGPDPDHFYYFANASGTSQAAPHVSGAAAVLFAAWPFLTAPQAANILLTTATDLGATGVDDIYGHGMLNLYKAVQAQGSNGFSYGASVAQTSYDVRQTAISTDPIFGDAFMNNVAPALEKAIFFDAYGRDYKAALDKKISAKGNASVVSNLNGILLNNYKTNNFPLSFTSNKAEGISTQIKLQVRSYANDMAARFGNIDRSLSDKALTATNGFSFAQNISQKNRISFSFNIDELTNSYSNKFNNVGFISVNSIAANPYQSFVGSFASQNLQVATDTQRNFNQLFFEHKLFEEKLKVNFSYQAAYQSSTVLVGKGTRQNQIMDVNFAYTPDEKTNLIFSLGNLNEFNNNFLNSQSVGAFEAGSDAKTSYTKIALSRELFKNLALVASYSEGITKAQGNEFGIFRDYQDIHSRSMSLGLTATNFFGGRFGVLYSEPLRVYSGKATIDVAVARDNYGNVTRYRGDVSLRPQGKQQNFEMAYGRDIGKNSQLNFNFLISKDVGNIKGRDARLGLVNYRVRF